MTTEFITVSDELGPLLHAIEFDEDDWLEIGCLDFGETPVFLDLHQDLKVAGQPFTGWQWQELAKATYRKSQLVRSGFYDMNQDDRDASPRWAAQLRRIANTIIDYFKKQEELHVRHDGTTDQGA